MSTVQSVEVLISVKKKQTFAECYQECIQEQRANARDNIELTQLSQQFGGVVCTSRCLFR